MDISRVGEQPDDGIDDWDNEEIEVDAVGKGVTCHSCGGWGHYDRECPTSKGKGRVKGDPGKGWGKPGAKAAGKGGFPSKEGFPGKGELGVAEGAG